jgi:CDP-6-deoxy-D-xylo-4-hexulose-3-dehydrase
MSEKKVWYAPNKFESYGEAEINAVNECLRDGWLTGNGPLTEKFEKMVSGYFGKKYGLFVNSGSSAVLLAIASLNLPTGTRVVTPACTFATSVAPIVQLGLEPVFIDVEIDTFVPNVSAIKDVFRAGDIILIPNLIGSKPDWETIRKEFPDAILIEDSADTVTNTPWTDISTTSFYSSHVVTAGGIGGMVMFNDEKLLKNATMLRDWGRIGDNSERIEDRFNCEIDGIPYDWKFLYGGVGYHMKASEMNAAFGIVQWNRLDEILGKRRSVFNKLCEMTGSKYNTEFNWLAFPMIVENRMEVINRLESNGIQTRVCFAGNITRHPAFRQYLQAFPNSDKIMECGMLVGAHHGMTEDDVDYLMKFL